MSLFVIWLIFKLFSINVCTYIFSGAAVRDTILNHAMKG